jgi:uncharacterized membrane protein YheB (UPF0754 family)
MLRIRSEQTRPFESQAETAFVERVMNYLRKNHADAVVHLPKMESAVFELEEKILRQMVVGGISRARGCGITLKSTLISFVVLMFIVAPNFDEDDRVQTFLSDKELTADERFEKLLDKLIDEEWDEIAEKYNAETWQLPVEAEVAEV